MIYDPCPAQVRSGADRGSLSLAAGADLCGTMTEFGGE